MTEKRFRIVNELGDYHIKDGDDELCYDLCSPSMAKENWNNVVNRLNELTEENQQLRNTIARLQLINDKLRDKDYTNYKKKIQELQEENKRLKKEIERCRDWLNSDKNDYQLTLAFIKNKGYSLKDVLEYKKELK